MKKCKVITITTLRDSTSTQIISNNSLSVWDQTATADVINKYLAQGYEVKHMMWQSSTVKIYFEKDV